jgi:hypothetical protein
MTEPLDEARRLIEAYRKDRNIAALMECEALLAGTDPDPEDSAARDRVLAGWLALLGVIGETLDPTFDPDDLPAVRVSPPEEDGAQAPPGIDPSMIRDPEKRRLYAEAITANRLKAERYATQSQLFNLRRVVLDDARAFMSGAYAGRMEEAGTVIAAAGLPDEVTAPLRAA